MLSLRIAIRYLISKKSHSAVNVISAISIAGVAVATAAIIVVLSVFNGFSGLARAHFSLIDPDLMVEPAKGKMLLADEALLDRIRTTEGVVAAEPTLTERGLLVADAGQLGVVFKGVTDRYGQVVDLSGAEEVSTHVAPEFLLDGDAVADMAIGVSARLDLRPGISRAELYVPRRVGRINPANPAGAFFSQMLVLENVLAVNQMEFDADHIIIPLDVARGLLGYENEASAIEIRTSSDSSPAAVAKRLREELGDGYTVATQEQQHEESYRMIAVEKWVTFAMLIFILVIAGFNIVSTLSLMVIEKRGNMTTLRFLGATRRMVSSVFMWMGAAITFAGGVIGLVLGLLLSLAQQYGGFIHLNGDPEKLTVTTYPVKVEAGDLLVILLLIIALSALTSLITRLFTRKIS